MENAQQDNPPHKMQRVTIDHLILKINDVKSSVHFYVDVMGFKLEGEQSPFTVIRVNDDFVIQLAPWGTEGHEHLITREIQ